MKVIATLFTSLPQIQRDLIQEFLKKLKIQGNETKSMHVTFTLRK